MMDVLNAAAWSAHFPDAAPRTSGHCGRISAPGPKFSTRKSAQPTDRAAAGAKSNLPETSPGTSTWNQSLLTHPL